jgi:hypothetical protein
MTRRRDSLPRHALAAYLEGEVTPSEAAAIEAHVRDTGSARHHLEQLDEIRRTLGRLPDRSDKSDAAAMAELWRAVESAPVARRSPSSRWSRGARTSAWLGAGACAALATLLLVRGASSPAGSGDAGSSARSGAEAPAEEFRGKDAAAVPDDRWVHIEVLRVEADGVAGPLPGRGIVHAGDRLVFRYASGGPDPFGFLMVFAVDSAKEIHWYYPAYETAGTDPSSVSISGDRRRAALPDAIEHQLPAGPLTFYGVFTHAPLHVLDVERRVEAALALQGSDPSLPPRLPIHASGQHLVDATVVP